MTLTLQGNRTPHSDRFAAGRTLFAPPTGIYIFVYRAQAM
jgi:hypothetical protein